MSNQILLANLSSELANEVISAVEDQSFKITMVHSFVEASGTLASHPHDALIMAVTNDSAAEAMAWLTSYSPANDMYLMWSCSGVTAGQRQEALDIGVDVCVDESEFSAGFERFVAEISEGGEVAATVDSETRLGDMYGASAAMRKVFRLLRRVAPTNAAVLLIGESGTGKELAASAVHSQSGVKDGEYVAVNCGAIPGELMESELFGHRKGSFTGADRDHAGFFERAQGGTLFLDEITEMSAELQVKLLRVLETGSYRRVGDTKVKQSNARIIAATNRDPQEALEAGELREDIYYRLAQFPVRIPALRNRGQDVLLLAERFLADFNQKSGENKSFTESALDSILVRDWPGNARELRNAVQQAHIMAGALIKPEHIPESLSPSVAETGDYLKVGVGSSLEDAERELIFATLERFEGNRQKTAETLGVSVKTVYNKLKQYDIDHEALTPGNESAA